MVKLHGNPEVLVRVPNLGAPHLHSVYTRHFAEQASARKSDGHGLSVNRPPMTAYDPGTTPPRADATPSGAAQKHDYETHRPVKSMLRRDVTDRGLLRLETVKAGQVQSLRGSGWPPKNGIVWIRI